MRFGGQGSRIWSALVRRGEHADAAASGAVPSGSHRPGRSFCRVSGGGADAVDSAGLAQLVEQLPCKHQVASSSLAAGTITWYRVVEGGLLIACIQAMFSPSQCCTISESTLRSRVSRIAYRVSRIAYRVPRAGTAPAVSADLRVTSSSITTASPATGRAVQADAPAIAHTARTGTARILSTRRFVRCQLLT